MAVAAAPLTLNDTLLGADPVAELRDAVAYDLRHGADRDELYDALDVARLRLLEAGRELDADHVADVMDFLVGYSSPQSRL